MSRFPDPLPYTDWPGHFPSQKTRGLFSEEGKTEALREEKKKSEML